MSIKNAVRTILCILQVTHLSSNNAISTIILMTIHVHRTSLTLGTASFTTLIRKTKYVKFAMNIFYKKRRRKNFILRRGSNLVAPNQKRNFLCQVRIFSSSFIYQLMVIIGADLAMCLKKLLRLKFSFENQ